ncbi:TetR/AcrR family transcriptional regulator [Robinsoniella peoriensis]|uniref:Putative acrAB operon repressor n=1 Tax=Robinsoniella peoriensis TaxID=180332 RepID=A0A4U8QAQ0_9FIRM|nr:TetR/AcrR family transcriptional regulator [Robinsoniella peoriensis]MDU7030480.1 TetR/AcrR family transcriptional regulator [Clostridiales bacterium]TLD02081.1 putative acrAB operon repressor [Robinsoniella peoriensis]
MKREEARQKTTSALLKIARKHFTQHGYYDVSLGKIAEEADVTRGAVYHHFKNKQGLFLAVLEIVQKDIAKHIEKEALKSDDPWQQLTFGCLGFVKGANAKNCRRILLVDAPVVIGWDAWRKADLENSMDVLQTHIDLLKHQGYLADDVDTKLMTYCISGALNELALNYPVHKTAEINQKIGLTIEYMVNGYRKNILQQ